MWPTLEIRWFLQGAPPPQMVAWFAGGERAPVSPPVRVDHYLRLPDNDGLGIKLREGKIEVKRRRRSQGEVELAEGVSGLMEAWHKWSFELARDHATVAGLLEPAADWIAVHKERQLRQYRVEADGRIAAIPSDELPSRGCSVELSTVSARGIRAWSLAFEAFGEEATLEQSLRLTARRLFRGGAPRALAAPDSHGYPRWLAELPSVK